MTPDRFLRVRHSRSSQVTASNPIPWTLASIQATTSKGAGNGCANGYAATLGYRQKYGQCLVFQDARLPVTPPRYRSRRSCANRLRSDGSERPALIARGYTARLQRQVQTPKDFQDRGSRVNRGIVMPGCAWKYPCHGRPLRLRPSATGRPRHAHTRAHPKYHGRGVLTGSLPAMNPLLPRR